VTQNGGGLLSNFNVLASKRGRGGGQKIYGATSASAAAIDYVHTSSVKKGKTK
jgi:hypothetical protein